MFQARWAGRDDVCGPISRGYFRRGAKQAPRNNGKSEVKIKPKFDAKPVSRDNDDLLAVLSPCLKDFYQIERKIHIGDVMRNIALDKF